MPSEGPTSAGTYTNIEDGWPDWNTAGSPITNSIGFSDKSDILRVTNFGFSVPALATIVGIEVSIDRDATGSGGCLCYDFDVHLRKNDGTTGSNYAETLIDWENNPGVQAYGGASDLWGLSLSDAEVNNTGFGVEIQVQGSGAPTTFTLPEVTSVTMTVYYSDSMGDFIAAMLSSILSGIAAAQQASQQVTSLRGSQSKTVQVVPYRHG